MSKVWQAQLGWEKERHAYQTGRRTRIKDKITHRQSEFALLSSAVGSPATYYVQNFTSSEVQMFQEDHTRLYAARGWNEEYIMDSEKKITDLEQKLRSAAPP